MISSEKKKKRQEIKTLLSSFSKECWREKSQKALTHFLGLLTDLGLEEKNCCLGVFAPLKDELDFLDELEQRFSLAFPRRLSNGGMGFFKCKRSDLVADMGFGVKLLVPSTESLQVEPDVLVVPGLAFSWEGERLGRGKGFYDSYLQKFKGASVGICTSEQMTSQIPVEPHDRRVQHLVTDEGYWKFCSQNK